MNANFLIGLSLGAVGGMLLAENKRQAGQMLNKVKCAATKAADTIKTEMSGGCGCEQQQTQN